MAEIVSTDDFILFYNRFREKGPAWSPNSTRFKVREIFLPRRLLNGIWDIFEYPPIELFCGSVDLFHGLHFVLPPVRKARRVLTVHDLTYLKYPELFADRMLNEKGYRHELPKGLSRADAVIAISQKTSDDLVELLNFPAERIRVIHLGVGEHFFKPTEGQSAAEILAGYDIKRPYLIFLVGTPEPRKNIARTIKAVQKASPKMDLVIIGPRTAVEKMQGTNPRNIKILSYVAEEHLPVLISRAHISLYPSLYEGFGLPVLESMACGAPVITSDRGSLPEIAGDAALLVDPEDEDDIAEKIRTLLEDETLRERLKELGKIRASEFSWEKAAIQTLTLYREFI